MSENNKFDFDKNEVKCAEEAPEIEVQHIPNTIENEAEAFDDTIMESEIDLDPAIEKIIEDNGGKEEFFENSENSYVEAEPLAPVMPKIERNEYAPWTQKTGNRGAKVFAIVVSFLIVASLFMTAGYVLGNKHGMGTSAPTVDLAKKPEAQDALTVSQIYNNLDKSIVGIHVYNGEGITSSATGVVYSKDGYIVTNDHIYSGTSNPKFKVYTSDEVMHEAEFIAGDTRSDLAVLKIKNAANLTPAIFGNSDELVVGETVVAVGRPNGATEKSIASEGVVSATSRRVAITTSYTGNYIQTDTAINPGSSGGALCNIYGQVIGITSAKLVGDEYDGVGFAIPTKTMKKNVDLLINHKYVKGRAKLGISYIAIDSLTAEISNSPVGLRVATIDKSSDLYDKSVVVGDIITKVEGKEISNSTIILDIIDSKTAGETLNLTVYSVSKKTYFDVSVKLLEDEGGSSYNKSTGTKNDEDKDDEKEDYNQSEFSFPNGD